MKPYQDTPSPRKSKPSFFFQPVLATVIILLAFAGVALAQRSSSDIWPESHIDCEKSRWEITVEDPKGRPVTVEIRRRSIILCGWVKEGWEMFTFNRKGCILKREDRLWMRNVDAAKIRQCFR